MYVVNELHLAFIYKKKFDTIYSKMLQKTRDNKVLRKQKTENYAILTERRILKRIKTAYNKKVLLELYVTTERQLSCS